MENSNMPEQPNATARKPGESMSRVDAARQFILRVLTERGTSFSLAELVSRALEAEAHFTPDETRGAASLLHKRGELELTDDLRVRLSSATAR